MLYFWDNVYLFRKIKEIYCLWRKDETFIAIGRICFIGGLEAQGKRLYAIHPESGLRGYRLQMADRRHLCSVREAQ